MEEITDRTWVPQSWQIWEYESWLKNCAQHIDTKQQKCSGIPFYLNFPHIHYGLWWAESEGPDWATLLWFVWSPDTLCSQKRNGRPRFYAGIEGQSWPLVMGSSWGHWGGHVDRVTSEEKRRWEKNYCEQHCICLPKKGRMRNRNPVGTQNQSWSLFPETVNCSKQQ